MRPRVVLCGSFHRDPDRLRLLFRELETTGCRVLSPLSLDFSSLGEAYVKTGFELDVTAKELESLHLRAIHEADFIFLHAPDGYVGVSAAFEIGYAEALHKPVFCKENLADEMLDARVIKTRSVFEALEQLPL